MRLFIKRIIALASVVILFPLSLYFFNFHGVLSDSPNNWESFGSYFGGISGSLLGFISTVLVVWTFQNQMKDSKVKNQQDTFFKLLEMLNHTLTEIKHKGKDGDIALRTIYIDWLDYIKELKSGGETISIKDLKSEYSLFYKKFRYILGHYFRLVYNIVKYIDRSSLDDDEKKQYIGFLKSMLSQTQLQLIFYNCLVGQGEAKFKPLIEKYHLFDNLEMDSQATILFFKGKYNISAYQPS